MTFPFRDEGPVEFAGPLPERADIVVIGGGVIGICAALYAAREGHSVVVLEKGRVAAEQSSRNWGWIRVQGRDLAEIPIVQASQTLWQDLDAECHGRLGLRPLGISYLARSEKEIAGFEGWLAEAKPHGVSTKMLSRSEIQDMLGCGRGPWIGAMHTPTDMKAEPWVAVPELARLAVASGARIVERCAARLLDRQAGRVTGVITEAGRIGCDAVIVAGGAWSSLFLHRHRIEIPQLSVRSTALATAPLPQVLNTAAVDDRMAMRPRADGGYTLAPAAYAELFIGPDAIRHARTYLPLALSGDFDVVLRGPAPKGFPDAFTTPRFWRGDEPSPFEAMRILDPGPAPEKVPELKRRFAQLYPQLGAVPAQAAWGGMIDVLPDVVPVVDRAAKPEGVVIATGMCGHGFGAGPGFGMIAARLAMGQDAGFDLSRFRLSRFGDGTKLQRGPNL